MNYEQNAAIEFNYRRIYRRGVAAFTAGKPRTANPHVGKAATTWLRGWLAAEKKANDEKRIQA